jgi:hypothetical protein
MKKYSLYLIVLILLMACKEKRQELLNIKASVQLNDELKENPLLMHPLTSSVNPKDSIMSTLYGNDIAFDYAKKNLDSNYPNGAVLYEVNWKQKPDELWFGANVPGEITSVEKIIFKPNNSSEYEVFEGKPLKKIKIDTATATSRKNVIISQRMAVSP